MQSIIIFALNACTLLMKWTCYNLLENIYGVCIFFLFLSWGHSFQTRTGCRPGPRPGFQVLIGLSGLIFFKKNQNDVVLIKRVTPGFSFSYFFFNPARFQPRIDPTSWAGFKIMDGASSIMIFVHAMRIYILFIYAYIKKKQKGKTLLTEN